MSGSLLYKLFSLGQTRTIQFLGSILLVKLVIDRQRLRLHIGTEAMRKSFLIRCDRMVEYCLVEG